MGRGSRGGVFTKLILVPSRLQDYHNSPFLALTPNQTPMTKKLTPKPKARKRKVKEYYYGYISPAILGQGEQKYTRHETGKKWWQFWKPQYTYYPIIEPLSDKDIRKAIMILKKNRPLTQPL